MAQLQQPLTPAEGHPAEPAPTSLCPRTARGHLSSDTPGGTSHPSRDQAASSSLSAADIMCVFSNEQISPSLLRSAVCNSVRHSGRACAPPALADLCQHFVLQPCRVFS